ncbi:hypothetical protein GCM10020366_37890 [Saccharopolyspora gregorii]|uniref:Uncharacterized protein n=1 Tax=Saccharopolyspora gregorii TaxID=33914 RepID=A0ABP6RTA2_9PSEU
MPTLAPPALTYHVTCDDLHGWAAVYRDGEAGREFLGFQRFDEEALCLLRANPTATRGDDGMLRCAIPA